MSEDWHGEEHIQISLFLRFRILVHSYGGGDLACVIKQMN